MVEFDNKSWPKNKEDKVKERNTFDSVNALYEGPELNPNAFKKGIISIKSTQGKEFKILTTKQMLQMLSVYHVQVKAGNTSEGLLNEIRQIVYSLIRVKEITKNVYFNKCIIQKWILYLWILKMVEHLIPIYFFSILQIKKLEKKGQICFSIKS